MSSPTPPDSSDSTSVAVTAAHGGYAALPRIAGWAYLVATALGRLPTSMVPLAVITAATAATDSLAVGGIAAAAAAFGEAAGAPTTGRLADRFGQRVVLLWGVVLHVAFLGSFAFAAGAASNVITVVLAGAAGATVPQIGPFSRARWIAMTDDLRAPFAFEGVLDEAVYIIGPAAVGIVAVVWSPQASVIVSGVLVIVFVTGFALHPSHALVPHGIGGPAARSESDTTTPGIRIALIAITFAGMLSMGTFFGSSQAGLTAFAEESGIAGAGALLYAVMAVGSAVTTLAMVAVPERVGPWLRWAIAAAGMLVGSVLLFTAGTVPLVIVAALLAGAFQGPLLYTLFSIAGSLAENGRASGLLAFVASGVVLGIGVGTAVSGLLAQSFGSHGAFAITIGATVMLLLLAAAGAGLSRSVKVAQASATSPEKTSEAGPERNA
jgi:MFS family permease